MDEQSSLYTALAVTLDGIADADERQQVREYIKRLEAERSELRAKLATIPLDDITYLWRFAPRNAASQRTCMRVGDWLQSFRK